MRLCRILTAIAVLFLVACKSTMPPPTPQGNQPPPVKYEQGPQAPSVGPRMFTPGIAVAPIQHSPWTTTTNDPTVTLQAQQPVSITTTNRTALEAHGLIKTTNSVNGALNVFAMGAVGDGLADDTVPLQSALNAAASGFNQTVFIPSGRFRITQQLVMPNNVSITGLPFPPGPHFSDPSEFGHGSWIYVDVSPASTNASIKLATNNVLRDLAFYYPSQLSGTQTVGSVVVYPPTIGTDGNLATMPVLKDLFFYNPYIAIEGFGFQRPIITDVEMGPLYLGIDLTFCFDSPYLTNIKVYPFYNPTASVTNAGVCKNFAWTNGTAFAFGSAGDVHGENWSVHGIHRAIETYQDTFPGIYELSYGMVNNLNIDTTELPILIDGASNYAWQFSNVSIVQGTPVSSGILPYSLKTTGADANGTVQINGITIEPYGTNLVRHPFEIHDTQFILNNASTRISGDTISTNASDLYVDGGWTVMTGCKFLNVATNACAVIVTNGGLKMANNLFLQHDRGVMMTGPNAVVYMTGNTILTGGTNSLYKGNGTLYPGPNIMSGSIVDLNFATTHPIWPTFPGTEIWGINQLVVSNRVRTVQTMVSDRLTGGPLGGPYAHLVYWADGEWRVFKNDNTTLGSITAQSFSANDRVSFGPSGTNAFLVWFGDGILKLFKNNTTTLGDLYLNNLSVTNLYAGFVVPLNMSASTLPVTDGGTNLVNLANQANSVLVNNGTQPYWFAGKTTNINVLCDGGVTNQFQFVSGVLSNIVSVP